MKPKLAPTLTDLDGVFVAGAAAGPKDIVDSIVEAGAAAMEASRYLAAGRRRSKGGKLRFEAGRKADGGRKRTL